MLRTRLKTDAEDEGADPPLPLAAPSCPPTLLWVVANPNAPSPFCVARGSVRIIFADVVACVIAAAEPRPCPRGVGGTSSPRNRFLALVRGVYATSAWLNTASDWDRFLVGVDLDAADTEVRSLEGEAVTYCWDDEDVEDLVGVKLLRRAHVDGMGEEDSRGLVGVSSTSIIDRAGLISTSAAAAAVGVRFDEGVAKGFLLGVVVVTAAAAVPFCFVGVRNGFLLGEPVGASPSLCAFRLEGVLNASLSLVELEACSSSLCFEVLAPVNLAVDEDGRDDCEVDSDLDLDCGLDFTSPPSACQVS